MDRPREPEDRGDGESKRAMLGAQAKASVVPVFRVSSSDVAAARAVVDAFLAERKMKVTPGAPLLGKSEFVQNHYLQLDLTAEESAALQKRLAALKETALASGSFEEEKKRVAEEVAKDKFHRKTDDAPAADEKADADAAKLSQEPLEKSARGRALNPDGSPRKKTIFVFEPLPKK